MIKTFTESEPSWPTPLSFFFLEIVSQMYPEMCPVSSLVPPNLIKLPIEIDSCGKKPPEDKDSSADAWRDQETISSG